MTDPHDILLKPVFTEKTYDYIADKRYTFIVDKRVNKTQIRQAVEAAFGVQVASVNTVVSEGKMKRQGIHKGRRASTKKAYVTLKKDSKGIEFFDSICSAFSNAAAFFFVSAAALFFSTKLFLIPRAPFLLSTERKFNAISINRFSIVLTK